MSTLTEEDRRFFQVHGLEVQPPGQLNEALVQAIEQMHRSLYGESASELTQAESQMLESAGVDLREHPNEPDPMATAAAEFAALLSTSLSSAQAAAKLGVHPSRIRQMISERALYAVQIDRRWRLPAYQFGPDGLVPNIAAVNAAIDPAAHPLAVYRWLTLPDPDLESDSGERLSPLQWLQAGYAPAPVVALAHDLAMT